jgi:hypothetical protein
VQPDRAIKSQIIAQAKEEESTKEKQKQITC